MTRAERRTVVHVIGTLDRGGAETVALDLCRAVPAAEVRQIFLTTGVHEGRLADLFRAEGAEVLRCPVRPVPLFPLRLAARFRQLRPDVVVSHISLVSGLVLAVAAVSGVRVRIARMHSDGDGRTGSLPREAQRSVLRAVLHRSATDVLGVSAAALAFAGGHVDDTRFRVLPNGVDLARYAGVRRRRTGPAVLTHIGRAAPEKNRAFLLAVQAEALRLDPGARLQFVGPGGTADLDAVEPAAVADRSVVLAGETDDVPGVLAGTDVLLLPSLREGLPGVVLEALAAGVPVLANDLPTLRELAAQVEGLSLLPLAAGPGAWARTALALADVGDDERCRYRDQLAVSPFALEVSAREWSRLWCASR